MSNFPSPPQGPPPWYFYDPEVIDPTQLMRSYGMKHFMPMMAAIPPEVYAELVAIQQRRKQPMTPQEAAAVMATVKAVVEATPQVATAVVEIIKIIRDLLK